MLNPQHYPAKELKDGQYQGSVGMSERIVISIVHDGEITEHELDDLAEAFVRLVPNSELEECYTEDAES